MAKMAIADQVLQRQDKDGMLRRALERIIQLYTDKSHFVYELLQNAEDCGASKIKFFQYEDRLEVVHDGRPFSLNNLQGLSLKDRLTVCSDDARRRSAVSIDEICICISRIVRSL